MVPNGWSIKAVADFLEKVSNPVNVTPEMVYHEIGIRSHGKGIFYKEPIFGKELGNKRVFYVEPDCLVVNIVFAWEQAIAKTTINEKGKIASHRFPMFKPRDNLCDIDYILYLFKSRKGKYLLELASPGGAGRNKTLGQSEFSKLELILPPIEEQKKIAKILSSWDNAISTTEQLLANSQQQKKALMQQLLTGKKRLLDSNGLRFSGEWITIPLEKLCHINPKRPPEPKDGLVSFIPMEFVSEDAKLLSTSERCYTDVSKGFTSFLDGDTLIAKITPCFENGKGCYVQGMKNGIGFGSTEFHVLRANKLSSPLYLYYITNTSEFRIKGEANMQGSAGQKRVTTDYLKSLKVTVPKQVEEQQKIAVVLSIADQEITALQQKIAALKLEKKALMQQLLTGKRRVKVEEAA
ncbi:restriction endonuclease subunit S [Aeromonas veronii]|uniref:restriction endonuclease subunit S n=1 Tax=Aeromonas veronii TaxID=654 RepID=UPI001C5A5F67|nr:restriction endonuclease subunit S [Aeromonas veronii]MBW3783183.1 restriction endonuclease subunit S [Aeromonas veronii]